MEPAKTVKKWTNDGPPTEIGDMIREAIVPPRLAAARYRSAATLPGATLQFIGEKTYDLRTGKLNGGSAVLQRAFTAEAGMRP